MKRTLLVAIMLLPIPGWADTLDKAIQWLESEWANIYYNPDVRDKESAYEALLNQAETLSAEHPERSEFYFWRAVIKATNAEHQDGLTALNAIRDARNLLLKAIDITPDAMNGSAYTTLGTLYYLAPGWPLAFGDTDKAEALLKTALKINPLGIDTNYYYGDFLLKQNELKKALYYFERAIKAPVRSEQLYADNHLKAEAEQAYRKLLRSNSDTDKNLIASSRDYTHNILPQ